MKSIIYFGILILLLVLVTKYNVPSHNVLFTQGNIDNAKIISIGV